MFNQFFLLVEISLENFWGPQLFFLKKNIGRLNFTRWVDWFVVRPDHLRHLHLGCSRPNLFPPSEGSDRPQIPQKIRWRKQKHGKSPETDINSGSFFAWRRSRSGVCWFWGVSIYRIIIMRANFRMYELFLWQNWGFCFGTFLLLGKGNSKPELSTNSPCRMVGSWPTIVIPEQAKKPSNFDPSRFDPTSYLKLLQKLCPLVNYGWWFRNPKANHRLDV